MAESITMHNTYNTLPFANFASCKAPLDAKTQLEAQKALGILGMALSVGAFLLFAATFPVVLAVFPIAVTVMTFILSHDLFRRAHNCLTLDFTSGLIAMGSAGLGAIKSWFKGEGADIGALTKLKNKEYDGTILKSLYVALEKEIYKEVRARSSR